MGAYEIELQPEATPYHAKAYPIPHIHTATLKMEVEQLCEAGVLKSKLTTQSGRHQPLLYLKRMAQLDLYLTLGS